MADLTITAANVGPASASDSIGLVQVGEAVTAGQPAYYDSSTQKYYRAKANDVLKDEVAGIFTTSAASDGFALLQSGGTIKIGATVVVGTIYLLSDTVGGIKPVADTGSADAVQIIGVGATTTTIKLLLQNTGIIVP